jgi:hypothetical protein
VIDDNGRLVQRSMVYTEYFARGTEPTTKCAVHASRGIFGSIAAAFTGGGEKQEPPHLQDAGLPQVAATSGAVASGADSSPSPSSSAPPEEPKKKRGFWSRVFGVGKDEQGRGTEKDKER